MRQLLIVAKRTLAATNCSPSPSTGLARLPPHAVGDTDEFDARRRSNLQTIESGHLRDRVPRAARRDRPSKSPAARHARISTASQGRARADAGRPVARTGGRRAGAAAIDDPAEQAAHRESIRLAFVAAVQHLPAKQRVVLLLCEVLRWRAPEVADLLETSVTAVNGALQRARATLADRAPADTDPLLPLDRAQRDLLERYVQSFERYDMTALRSLLHEDATQTMPPFDLWLRGLHAFLETARSSPLFGLPPKLA